MKTFKQLLEQRTIHLEIVTESTGTPMYAKHIGKHQGKNYLQIAIEHHKNGALDSVIKDLDDERREIVAKAKSFKAGMLHDHAIKGLTAAKKHLPETEKAGPESGIPSKLKTESAEIVEKQVGDDEEGGFEKTKKSAPPKDDEEKEAGKKMGKKKLSDLRTAKSSMKDVFTTCEDYSPNNPKIDIHVGGKYHASTNWSPTVKHAVQKFKEKYPEHADKGVTANMANESVYYEEEVLDENWYHPVQVGEIGDGTAKVKLYRGKGGAIITKHYLNGKLVTMEHKHGKSRPIGEAIEITEDEYTGVGHSAFKKKEKEEKAVSKKGTYGTSHSAEDDEEKEEHNNPKGYSGALGAALGLGALPRVPDEKKMRQLAAAGKARIVKHNESTDFVIDKVGVVYEFYVITDGEIVVEGSAPTETGAISQAKRLFESIEKVEPTIVQRKSVVEIAKKIAKSS